MKVFLTGGSGDLGTVLTHRLQKRGDTVLRYDVREPSDTQGQFIKGSVLDREQLSKNLQGVDCIVHIAAWNSHHESRKNKNVYDFWDLNVTGTFNVFQAALEANVKKIIFISSDAVESNNGVYGWSKILGEEIAQRYIDAHYFSVLTLRPCAFIPHWNREHFQSFAEWAKWFCKGAVHINDVAQAIIQGIDLISQKSLYEHLVLPIDGAHNYTESDIQQWDKAGSGSTFKKYYDKYYSVAMQYGLDLSSKPTWQDISDTKDWLGYSPSYRLENMFEDLIQYGEKGPAVQFD